MKREELKTILEAIEDEDARKAAIDRIMAINGTDINKVKNESHTLSDKVGELTSENEKLKTENESLKAQDFEGVKAENAKLKTEKAEMEKQYKAQIADRDKQDLVKEVLVKEKAKDIGLTLRNLDLSKVSINDKGELDGLDDQIKALKENEITKSFFEDAGTPNGAKPKGGQPAGGDPSKMSYSELTDYLNNGGTL